MRVVFILILVVILLNQVSGWELSYTLPGDELRESFRATGVYYVDEGLVVIGVHSKGLKERYFVVMRINPIDGAVLWARKYTFEVNGKPLPPESLPAGRSIVLQSGDGMYIITPVTFNYTVSTLIIRTNIKGDIRWAKLIVADQILKNRSYKRQVTPIDAIVSEDNSLYILARSRAWREIHLPNGVVMKFSPDGDLEWATVVSLKGTGFDPRAVVFNSSLYIMGTSAITALGGARIVVLKLDSNNGSVLEGLSIRSGDVLYGDDMTISDALLYILAHKKTETIYPVIIASDGEGILWSKKINGRGVVPKFLLTDGERLYMAGIISGIWGGPRNLSDHAFVVGMSREGEVIWARAYPSPALNGPILGGFAIGGGRLYGFMVPFGSITGFGFSPSVEGEDNCGKEISFDVSPIDVESGKVNTKNILAFNPNIRIYDVNGSTESISIKFADICSRKAEVTVTKSTTSIKKQESESTTTTHITTKTPSRTTVTVTGTLSKTTKPPTKESPARSTSKSTCGPVVLVVLVALPTLLRKRL
ncbi:hypothetical protein A3L04_04120 [Thermococcus chitonophagus]|uniref:CGP-CTERM sorting domain-containing protein n=1 Tax=Thermococcus chitonophagus TaxID=54262 RepID=A0A170STQ3_9EURY|nr:CGP-CTERM sorting domain-containing protein [Thermococcus chitonophagus]ASJ16316.1 hypothetical protein A3L04_04120 [Thermococcus chitonophagus]CUX78695.1 hypothetical protein CHITON_1916 [Thermococcus chitonophagus]